MTPPPVTTSPTTSGLLMPPVVPQPAAAGDIVGVTMQNTTASTIAPRLITFGQPFRQGQVHASDNIVARSSSVPTQAQVDPLAVWPDGSVKLGAISLALPSIAAGGSAPLLLSEARAGDPAPLTAPVNLMAAPFTLTASLVFTSGQYSGTQTIDLAAALRTALATNPVYWLRGPLATQARVDVPLGGPMHVTADVTAYADGSVTADVQFNDDVTTIVSTAPAAALPPNVYTASVALNGNTQTTTVTQYQYQDWHTVITSTGAPILAVVNGAAPAINVQHDAAYLESTQAILPYSLTTGEAAATVQGYAATIAAPGFGMPLAVNGVTQYMGETGGRADIGYTTQWNTSWIVTGDARAATLALAQLDTDGAITWNFRLGNGRWITPAESPKVWADASGRGNPTFATLPSSAPGWLTDASHQPDLAYIPYLMTASHWALDRLNAQAAYSISQLWPSYRCMVSAPTCDILTQFQVRGQAWTLREVLTAAFVGYPGSFEETYFTQVLNDNFAFMQTDMEPALALGQGQMLGFPIDSSWFFDPKSESTLGGYGWSYCAVGPCDNSKDTEIKPWEIGFYVAIMEEGAWMGYPRATQVVNWMRGWMLGQYLAPGINPRDGFVYQWYFPSPTQGLTWAALQANNTASGISNGTTGWNPQNGGYYAPISRTGLYMLTQLNPGDTQAAQALGILNGLGAPNLAPSYLRADPTYNVSP